MKTLYLSFLALAVTSSALHLPFGLFEDLKVSLWPIQKPTTFCENKPTSRQCWGQYNTNTNYYTTFPDTGKTVEVWLSVQQAICNQDGYQKPCTTFNGTMPGPTINADWGDDVIIHVTNNLEHNGTTIHFHGLRQFNSTEYDGVPGVTQCPIRPGESFTYIFKVTQYGSTWYHSHFSLQYSDGLFGPMVLNGPATADYDEDLGPLLLQDWSHTPIFGAWTNKQRYGITHPLSNLLINGTNTFDCSRISDLDCIGGGKKFETMFEHGKRYLIRLINVSTDSQFKFSIDNHTLKVIASDFVPIEPYETDGVVINAAQRYDVVVEANALPGDYWLRGGWVQRCLGVANDLPDEMTGIVRYDAASTSDPTTTSTVEAPAFCGDEPLESLIPYMDWDVTNIAGVTVEQLSVGLTHTRIFQWTINSSSLVLDWTNPTLQRVFNNESIFPTSYNVVPVDKTSEADDEWAVLVIENKVVGLLGGISHPIHLHGHDFWILAQEFDHWDGSIEHFTLQNPPRRDTAVLPAQGYLAIAFRLDNPGTWLLHCHIAWHASQGLSLEFLESERSINISPASKEVFRNTCKAWNGWAESNPHPQDGSGI